MSLEYFERSVEEALSDSSTIKTAKEESCSALQTTANSYIHKIQNLLVKQQMASSPLSPPLEFMSFESFERSVEEALGEMSKSQAPQLSSAPLTTRSASPSSLSLNSMNNLPSPSRQ